ncbi:MAG TPA: aldo/keto reductase [Candidatus Dormibacteraeota bacterium]|nr:aldo/keto reductase [Candidatus Dormibacteraeota bacterium]
MEYRPLGRTGVKVSAIGLGCGGFGGIGSEPSLFGRGENQEQASALMDHAVELGINYFDTADSYGGGLSEEMVGRWMRDRGARDRILLATKVFTPMGADPNSGGLSRRHIMRAVDDSLRRLQTDRIDIYMAHQVDPATDLEETMRAFGDLVTSGKVLYLGFCNIETWRVVKSLWISERIAGARLTCVQNEYNLLHSEAEAEMLPVLAGEGVAFVAFSPMAGGWLSGKYSKGMPAPAGSRMELRPEPYAGFQTDRTYDAIDRVRAIARSMGTSTGALALAWAASHPHVTSIVAGPRNLEQFATIEEALRLSLGAEERLHIQNESLVTA